jgi:hypothetical protein
MVVLKLYHRPEGVHHACHFRTAPPLLISKTKESAKKLWYGIIAVSARDGIVNSFYC